MFVLAYPENLVLICFRALIVGSMGVFSKMLWTQMKRHRFGHESYTHAMSVGPISIVCVHFYLCL